MTRVVNKMAQGDGTPSSDNQLRKFYKGLLQKFHEEQPSLFGTSNIHDVPGLLTN